MGKSFVYFVLLAFTLCSLYAQPAEFATSATQFSTENETKDGLYISIFFNNKGTAVFSECNSYIVSLVSNDSKEVFYWNFMNLIDAMNRYQNLKNSDVKSGIFGDSRNLWRILADFSGVNENTGYVFYVIKEK